jgi:dUTP pyrophosphatase
MKIRIINKSKHNLPEYTTRLAIGMDIRANIDEDIVLEPMKRALIITGLFLELLVGYEAQIILRSGLAINKGVTVLNSPGTIDADYRGKVCTILINLSDEKFVIKDGERICHMIIVKHEKAEWVQVDELVKTDRGPGVFGYTGKH